MSIDNDISQLHERLQRSTAVGAGCAADIAINYPMWIVAKRMGIGIAAMPPTLPELYKGGGILWFSYGPTTMLEDVSKQFFEDHLLPSSIAGGRLGVDRELVSSAFAGAFAAATFCAQVEHVITVAHARDLSMAGAFRHIYHTRGGVGGVILPHGILAMMCREMPFVSAMFYVRPAVTARVYGDTTAGEASAQGSKPARRLHLEVISGIVTSWMTSPLSHVPSVVAAYQQGHGVGLRQACSDIHQQGGWRAFWRGLIARTFSIAGTMIVVPMVIDAHGGGG